MTKANQNYAERGASENDKIIGQRIRARRLELGLSQLDLARPLKVAPQQVQKYERGANRISCGRILEIAAILDCSVAHFFKGLGADAKASERKTDPISDGLGRMMATSDGQDLVRFYMAIKTPAVRKRVVGVVQAVAESGSPKDKRAARPTAHA